MNWQPKNPYEDRIVESIQGHELRKHKQQAWEEGRKAQERKIVEWLEEHNEWPRIARAIEVRDVGHLMMKAEDWQALKAEREE